MGRPIKKSRFSTDTTNDGDAGKIEVTAYFPVGGSLQTRDNSFVIAQRSSQSYLIKQYYDSSNAVLKLKGVAPAELVAGEFCVKVTIRNDDSSVVQDAYVTRFYNNTVKYAYNNGANTGTVKYTLGTAAGEDSTVSGEGQIDVI